MYESLRQHVSGNLAGLPDHELAEALANRNIDAEAMEGFFDDLGKFAARAAPAVLPIAGVFLRAVADWFGRCRIRRGLGRPVRCARFPTLLYKGSRPR